MINNSLTKTEKNSEFYYHGTNKEYLDMQISKYGTYQHDNLELGNKIFISTQFKVSEWYARDRTRRSLTPIVLKIYGNDVRDRIQRHPDINDICLDKLILNEFEIIILEKY